jgi:hypothetical protein
MNRKKMELIKILLDSGYKGKDIVAYTVITEEEFKEALEVLFG